MAIDYGRKRIGIAETDALQIIASPLCTIPHAELMRFLEKHLQQNQVDTLVLGNPKTLSGQDNDISEEIRQFAANIQKKYPALQIVWIDEFFTSKMASASILASGVSKKKRQDKGLVDKVAAVLILQSYMSQQSRGY